ncbi:AhpC-TSA-domain-containing protein [Thelephora terrestris]|uniref:thioredoxin-dependent peroxiredoxin n=1 Tax=Thelephora terrestris TaxID=56493 RepID=A0A9P6HJJ7_9AGAM|nr:AhpC-TSA-domain-containing protein [Thelephora terrestris]
MPRKAAAKVTEDGEPEVQAPRRSTRITSQPKPTEPEEPTKPVKKPAAPRRKKRNAGEADAQEENGQEDSVKKAKLDEPAEGSSSAGLAAIDIGDSLPSYTLKNEKSEDVDICTLTAEKGLVLFLVPKADTPGCTTQACGFRDIYPDFTSQSYEVYCLSADSPVAQTKWQTKKNLPYPLLSDPKRVLIKALTGGGTRTARSHFIFEKGGKLVEKKNPVKAAESPRLALEFIKGLDAEAMAVDAPTSDVTPAETAPAEPEEAKEA